MSKKKKLSLEEEQFLFNAFSLNADWCTFGQINNIQHVMIHDHEPSYELLKKICKRFEFVDDYEFNELYNYYYKNGEYPKNNVRN